jgi:hypothetical protein
MTRGRIAVAVVAALAFGLVASLALASGKHDKNGSISAKLNGYEETPSNIVAGQGRFTAQVASDKITFKLEYSNLSGNPMAAHIHVGQKGVAGGVSGWICGGGGQPNCPASTSGSISGTIAAANVTGPAAQGVNPGDLAGLITAIKHLVAYANMHTAKFGGGEIRGQIKGGGGHDNGNDDH